MKTPAAAGWPGAAWEHVRQGLGWSGQRCVRNKTRSASSQIPREALFTFLLPSICVEKLQKAVRQQLLLIVQELQHYRPVMYWNSQEQLWLHWLQGGHMTQLRHRNSRLRDTCGGFMYACQSPSLEKHVVNQER